MVSMRFIHDRRVDILGHLFKHMTGREVRDRFTARLPGLSGTPIEEGPHRSIRTSHSLLWIHGHIGVDELVDQVLDSGLEDMDVLVRLDADHVLSHP